MIDPLVKSEVLAVAASPSAVRVRRKGADSMLPFEAGMAADNCFSVDRCAHAEVRREIFDEVTESLDLTGAEPFSMTAWVYLPKIDLHPGQTGGSLALVIAGQLTAGDSERTPPVAPTGWVFEIDEGVARLRLVEVRERSSARRLRITSRSRLAPGITSLSPTTEAKRKTAMRFI